MAMDETLLGEVRNVKLFSNGKIIRQDNLFWPDVPSDPNFESDSQVGSKDITLDTNTGLWCRIYIPRSALEDNSKKKLPVLVYYHGGGFVAFNPGSSLFHNFCKSVCPKLGIFIISVAYRLAPEHRLPIAFEDSFAVLVWMQEQANKPNKEDPWLEYADFSNCFLMGGSAGGTIVHYMCEKATQESLEPVEVKGVVPVVPFFGTVERSESELRSLKEPDVLTLADCDTFWFFSLPEGTDRDHPYCKVPRAEHIMKINMPPCLIVIGAKDVLHTRQVEYYEEMKKAGKDVKLLEYKNRGHMLLFPEVEDDLEHSYEEMIQFMKKCTSV